MKLPIPCLAAASLLGILASSARSETRVFYTGHSFSTGPHEWMGVLAEQAGLEGYGSLGRQMVGGSRVLTHWNLPEERHTAKAALMHGGVDVLVLSPNMQIPDPGIDHYVEFALEYNPDIRVLVQGSWMTWDGLGRAGITNAERDARPVAEVRERTAKHLEGIRDQLRRINERAGREVCTLVPVGAAVVRLRERLAEGKLPGFERPSQLFSDDIGHACPAVPHLTTYLFYIALFDRDPRELPGLGNHGWTQRWGEPPGGLAKILQQIAWETMEAEGKGG